MAVRSVSNPQNPTFDFVEVKEGSSSRRYTFGEFMDLELATRIRLIIGGAPRFTKAGQEIPKAAALALNAA